ncbi:FAD-binding oxidoreductase [Nocardiopsis changdeensis]|uniref:FAD-binding oxidoreductase n=1 Tax=Nocardiopsis changdeensis TaxID=2831969 RepID=A0ABX8BU77_9ACTN|nr:MULTISPECIES: FAD-binding oxidoreductase [Nocardiopsis]QUX25428.1 FAD-binding oxidoreductase [Nocardiopsis changdeensis]QYX35814.1 FAD-binding oxidoreductase [Nocardiopsis sp. MT53]
MGVRGLESVVRGRVLAGGDAGFGAASRPWNLAVEQEPVAVVEVADAGDVAAVVRWAGERGLSVAAQATGHGATGSASGAVLVRTGALDGVEVDPVRRTARVGAGVSWGRVQEAAAVHGLTGLPGSSPGVGVVGYTLGGGLGWFGRRHGWAADAVRAWEVVDAGGGRARVSAQSDPDLFWALCGGGGDAVVVTGVELELFGAPELYAGAVVWPVERAARVAAVYEEVLAGAPEELSVWWSLHRFPGAEPLVSVQAAFLGSAAVGEKLLAPLVSVGGSVRDTLGVLPLTGLGSVSGDPVDPTPGLARTELLTGAVGEWSAALAAEPLDPLFGVQVRGLGGALAGPSATPFGPLTEPFYAYAFGAPVGPGGAEAVRSRLERLFAGVAVSGRKPLTALAGGEPLGRVFSPGVLERLGRIKRERDPRGVVRAAHPVLG